MKTCYVELQDVEYRFELRTPERVSKSRGAIGEHEPSIVSRNQIHSINRLIICRYSDVIEYSDPTIYRGKTALRRQIETTPQNTRISNSSRKYLMKLSEKTGIHLDELLAVREIEIGNKFLIEDFLRKVYGESFEEITIPALR